jgi:uncharacterized membrane protein YheB (UPF0754 family)
MSAVVDAVLADLGRHWPVYAAIPFVAALIGYVTKRVAIKMMFEPVEFVGVKPFLGWQGVLPANAERMARTATKMLTENLVSPQEIFARLDPDKLAKEIEQPLLRIVGDVTREVMEQHQPRLWGALPATAQQILLKRVQSEAPRAIANIMREISLDIDEVLDLEYLVVTNLVRDKLLLNRLIRDISQPEMRFILRSGVVFGFILGCIQLLVWALTKSALVLPIFGVLIGWFTDWLALKMIFLPRKPRRFFGFYRWQGIFHKRRHQVATDYGTMIAEEIMTVPHLVEAVLRGPKSDRLFQIITREVERTMEAQAGAVKPFMAITAGSDRFQEMKEAASAKAVERIPETVHHAETYAINALDVRNTIVSRMRMLSPIEFESLLRPAFRQDEWKLIAVGAVIGGLVGEIQSLLLLH